MQLKQCICPECGKIAEIRRAKNGKRLRYLHCVNGHGGIGSRVKADFWQSIEVDYLGVLGDTLPTQSNEEVKPMAATEDSTPAIENIVEDFKPATEDLPENAEPEPKPAPAKADYEDSESLPSFVKYGLGFLALLGCGSVMYAANKKGKL
jgi:hypothetical protein